MQIVRSNIQIGKVTMAVKNNRIIESKHDLMDLILTYEEWLNYD